MSSLYNYTVKFPDWRRQFFFLIYPPLTPTTHCPDSWMGKVGVCSFWRRTAMLCNLPFSVFLQHHLQVGPQRGGVRLLCANRCRFRTALGLSYFIWKIGRKLLPCGNTKRARGTFWLPESGTESGQVTSLPWASVVPLGNGTNHSAPARQTVRGLNGMLPIPRCSCWVVVTLSVWLIRVREGTGSADLGVSSNRQWLDCQAAQMWLELSAWFKSTSGSFPEAGANATLMSTHPLMGSQLFLLCALLFAQVSSYTESQWLPTILATPGPGHELSVSLVDPLVNMVFSHYIGILDCSLCFLALFGICYSICLFSFACWRQSITLYPRMALRVFCPSISDYRHVPPCLVYSFLHKEDTQIVITMPLTIVTHWACQHGST